MSNGTDTTVFVIDDDRDFSESLVQLLEVEGHEVASFSDPFEAIKRVNTAFPGVILLDVRMPRVSGEDVLDRLLEIDTLLPVILITGHGDVPMAVRALKKGAYGFFTKPLQLDEFMNDVRRAIAARQIELERRKLAHQLEMRDGLIDVVVGTSPNMLALRKLIVKIGSADVDVLVQGETGSGKEVVSKAVIEASARRDAAFVAVNCGHISRERSAEELFGIETVNTEGETNVRAGKFELANGGVLLLDEIESMTPDIQVRLLRVLQERTLERINGLEEIKLDIRIIATTKVDLKQRVREGQFREDLFYRLNGVTLVIPPLRERGADPVILFENFIKDRSAGAQTTPITPDLMTDLLSHDWPGNVRELQNAADRYVAGLSVFGDEEDLPDRSTSLSARIAKFEKDLIVAALTHNKGSLKRTMLDLDVPRKTLHDKLTKYGLKRETFQDHE